MPATTPAPSTIHPTSPSALIPQISANVQFMLEHLDERAQAIELSPDYANALTRDEWIALTAKAWHNHVPLRALEQAT